MKHLKALGLATLMAMTMAAFLPVGSASATRLCATNTSPCPESWNYFTGTSIRLSLQESSALETTSGTVLDTCTESTIEGPTTTFGGATETVQMALTNVSWGGCTKTTDTIVNGELELHWIEPTGNGTVTGKSTQWTINTVFGSCTYGFGTGVDLGTLKGGNPATLSINAMLLKISGLCPSEARWTANYRVTSPWPLWVVTA